MGRWIDDVSRQIALGSSSRRHFLRRGIGAAVASLFGRHEAAHTQDATPVSGDGQRVVCSIAQRDLGLAAEYQLDDGATVSISGTSSAESSPGVLVHSLHIVYLGEELANLELTHSPTGLIAIEIQWGPGVQGVRSAMLTSDGRSIWGTVDNREFLPFPLGADVATLTFADGLPAPDVAGPVGAIEALQRVFLAAETLDCPLQSAAAIDGVGGPGSLQFPAAGVMLLSTAGRSDNTAATTGCITCKGGCVTVGIGCAVAAAAGCTGALFGYGICLAAGLAGCAVLQVACMEGCHAAGMPCCPVQCGEGACCFGGDTCLDPTRGVCCPPNTAPCGNRICCDQGETCLQGVGSGTCCPASQQVCAAQTICCPPGEKCAQGTTCCPEASPVLCAGTCCRPGEKCAQGDTCCPEASPAVCQGTCCQPGEGCVDGLVCCSGTQETCRTAGGFVCCPHGEECRVQLSLPAGNRGTCCPVERQCGLDLCCSVEERCTTDNFGNHRCELRCPPPRQACAGVCCTEDTACINGVVCCTEDQQICQTSEGFECCAPGEQCLHQLSRPGPNKRVCCAPDQQCGADLCCGVEERCATDNLGSHRCVRI
jgi:hypothetical protein